MNLITLYILIVIFIATVVRSTFGFGESLVAVPLLILLIPVEIAVPLSVLLSILIAAVVVVQDRKQIHFHSARWLIIFAVLGIPIGLFMLVYGNENFIKLGLGVIIILYSVYSIGSKTNFKLEQDDKKWLFVCGFYQEYLVLLMALMGRHSLFMARCVTGQLNISELLCKRIFYR